MTNAAYAIVLLLAPWALYYLAVGIVVGPAMLGVARLRHGLRLRLPVDLIVATLAWPVVGAHLVLAETTLARHGRRRFGG